MDNVLLKNNGEVKLGDIGYSSAQLSPERSAGSRTGWRPNSSSQAALVRRRHLVTRRHVEGVGR
jgi:hypothetical protein